MRENNYQLGLIKRIKDRLPGSVVLKNDSGFLQGIPDLTVLWQDRWAILEVKPKPPTSKDFEPNQEWYLDMFDAMSFATCIYPENEEEVLDALEQAFRARRKARVSKR